MICAVCMAHAKHWADVDGFSFTDCPSCNSISIDIETIKSIDNGTFVREYNEAYWSDEIKSAKERCWGANIARAMEAIYLCRRPVSRFIDVACGSGYSLDALSYYLPTSSHKFFGIELFPPAQRTQHQGFMIGDTNSLKEKYDCGMCIEVIEHLTPKMLTRLLQGIAQASNEHSLYIFNTGLAPFVRDGNESYIDPVRRGHIISYDFKALEKIFGDCGFKIYPIGNRTWAFAAEYTPTDTKPVEQRLWHPLSANREMLHDPASGSVPYLLALESLRAYIQ